MNVLVLQGSPRRKGNTETVLDAALEPLREMGAHVETAHVSDLDIRGCRECYTCQKSPSEPNCAIDDDMQTLYPKILKADLVILATPVFCWGPSAQLKAPLDRLYALCKFDDQGGYCSLLAGKGFALVLSAGGDAFDGADLVVEGYRRLVAYSHGRDRGVFAAVGLRDPESTANDAPLMVRAREFGHKLLRTGGGASDAAANGTS